MPHMLRRALGKHDVFTVAYLNWIGIKNGELIKAAEANGFDVLITSDQGIPHQQNLSGMRLCLVVLPTPDWNVVKRHLSVIAEAVDDAKPESICPVRFPNAERRRDSKDPASFDG